MYQTSDFNILKFHLLAHIPEFIKSFGHPMNYDTGTFESAHKWNVKGIFKLTNKSQDAASQMMRHLSTIETCNVLSFLYDRQNGLHTSHSEFDCENNDDFETELTRDMSLFGDDQDDGSENEDNDDSNEKHGSEEDRCFVVIPVCSNPRKSTIMDDILRDLTEISGLRDEKEVCQCSVFYLCLRCYILNDFVSDYGFDHWVHNGRITHRESRRCGVIYS